MSKVKIAVIMCIALVAIGISGCNYDLIDTQYKFNYAYINVSGQYHVEGKVESWTDYEDGDQLQVTIDGVTYLTHASNVTLVYDPNIE